MAREGFYFNADDWLNSEDILCMTPAEEGAYIHLLALAWKKSDCSLPDDDIQLSKLSRLGEQWFNHGSGLSESAKKIRKCFVVNNCRLYNQRLLFELKKYNDFVKKQTQKGIMSGKKRNFNKIKRQPRFNHGSTTAEPRGNRTSTESNLQVTGNRYQVTDKEDNKKSEGYALPSQEQIQESSKPKIIEQIDLLAEKLYNEGIFKKVHAFKNKHLKHGRNERAILHVLSRCYLSKPEEPWGYCENILKVENPNYNERDHIKSHQ